MASFSHRACRGVTIWLPIAIQHGLQQEDYCFTCSKSAAPEDYWTGRTTMNLVTLLLLPSHHLWWHGLHCYKPIPSLHSFAACLSTIIILCNWPCQKSPYITTATPGTCLETHACLHSLSVAIFCTWMDSTLLQEILKIKKTYLQASGTHWAWHVSFSWLSQTVSVYYSSKRHVNNRCQWENNNLLFSQPPSLHSSRASSLNGEVFF